MRPRELKTILIIACVGLILRLLFSSPYLEDWDSVQFATALNHYSVIEHLPHPPGYPLYIILGKIFQIIFQSDLKALTILSAVLGAFSVVPIYLLTLKMFGKTTAIISCLIFIFTPVHWSLSEVALTNIPGLFFLNVFACLLYLYNKDLRKVYFVSYFGGSILGFRFTEFPIIISLLFFVIIKNKYFKRTPLILLTFILGLGTWLIPLMFYTGIKEFIDSYFWIGNYVISHDALLGQSLSLKMLIRSRMDQLFFLLKIAYTNIFLILSSIALVWILLTKKIRSFKYQYLFVWLIAYLMPLTFIFNLEVPRYTLPLVSPLAILTAAFFYDFAVRSKLAYLLIFLCLFSLFLQSYSQVFRFKNSIPPIIQAVNFVKKNFESEDTAVLSGVTYRHFQYFAPEFKPSYDAKLTQININKKYLILDFLGSKEKVIERKDYKMLYSREFIGDKDIYSRVPKISVYILSNEKN